MRASRKQDLIDTAASLFDRQGFTATGIDRIIDAAGVAKMTLYNNFESKESLAAAVIEEMDGRFRARIEAGLEEAGGSAEDRLLSLFDILEGWYRSADFRGCLFMKSAAEFPDPKNPVRRAALAHKAWLLSVIKQLVAEAEFDHPADLAGHLFLLMEGATTVAHQTGDVTAAARARKAAERLLKEPQS